MTSFPDIDIHVYISQGYKKNFKSRDIKHVIYNIFWRIFLHGFYTLDISSDKVGLTQ